MAIRNPIEWGGPQLGLFSLAPIDRGVHRAEMVTRPPPPYGAASASPAPGQSNWHLYRRARGAALPHVPARAES